MSFACLQVMKLTQRRYRGANGQNLIVATTGGRGEVFDMNFSTGAVGYPGSLRPGAKKRSKSRNPLVSAIGAVFGIARRNALVIVVSVAAGLLVTAWLTR